METSPYYSSMSQNLKKLWKNIRRFLKFPLPGNGRFFQKSSCYSDSALFSVVFFEFPSIFFLKNTNSNSVKNFSWKQLKFLNISTGFETNEKMQDFSGTLVSCSFLEFVSVAFVCNQLECILKFFQNDLKFSQYFYKFENIDEKRRFFRNTWILQFFKNFYRGFFSNFLIF